MQRLSVITLVLATAFLSLTTLRVAAQNPSVPPGYILVDDMFLPADVFQAESAFTATQWTGNHVPYAFNANVSAANQQVALTAMAELSATAFITFTPHANEPNWIVFNDSDVNNSMVGMIGGAQTINVTSWGVKFRVVHELMHALGYVHEQSRPDRDNYVTINTANILSGYEANFAIIGSNMVTPYDFLSIMHYDRLAFNANNQDTITCQPAYSSFQSLIGNRLYMTTSDVLGLQSRYSPPLAPTATSISPTTVSTSSPVFTLDVYGSRFFQGSMTGAGVVGTQITWDGSPISTAYVDSGHVTTQIPVSFISQPLVHQIGVINAYPAGGASLSTHPLSVVCSSSVLALAPNLPATVTNGCQQFSITPTYSTCDVVAISSPSNWDITMGTGTASGAGGTCDFLVGSGFFGAGTITPANGNVTLQSGGSAATLQYVTATPLNTGSPTIASISAGSVARAFYFSAAASSTRRIDVAGPITLWWKLIWAGNSFGWRGSESSTYVVAQGECGIGPTPLIPIGPSVYTLVIYSNSGPVTSTTNFTINEGFDFTPISLTPANDPVAIASSPQDDAPFTIAAQAGHWNLVGVASASDWDIQLGPAVSQFGGTSTDYIVANGHLGPITPVTGATSPFSFPASTGYLHFAPTMTIASVPGSNSHFTSMLLCYEVNIPASGSYNFAVSVTAGSGWTWDLHAPGIGPQWKSRSNAISQGNPANGVPVTISGLNTAWHCVVLRHDGGQGPVNLPTLSVTAAAVAPMLTSITPASAPASSGTFDMTVNGSSFTAASQVLWNGAAIPTTFVSSGVLTGHVDNSLIPSPGSASVTVAAAAGTSNALTFSIGNAVPVATSVSPAQAVTGDPSLTISVFGSGFSTASEVRWDGSPLPTTFVSGGQLDAFVDASNLLSQLNHAVTVFTPPPGGGTSGAVSFMVLDPVLFGVSPPSMTAVAPGSASFPATLFGAYFTPYSIVYANDVALPTTFTSATTLDVMIDPAAVPQATVPGAIALAVVNTEVSTSNMLPLVIGGGNDAGLIRLQPLAPAPGSTFTLRLEGMVPLSPLVLIADFGNPVPVGGFPDLSTNFVLGVTEAAGSNGAWSVLFDGLGLFGPPDGVAADAGGVLQIPGLTMPNPPLGVSVVIQAAYVDPGSPIGVSLTWPLYVIQA